MSNYWDLKVWQLGMEIAKEIYLLTRDFPKHEVYGLSSQIQRAAVSIPSNLAEGRARDSTKEFMRHVSFAQGSLAELETQLRIAEFLGYGDPMKIRAILAKCAEERRMLGGLQVSLKAKLEM
ncbi:MAG: four helix bundle protein [Pirellulales bacterium]|nr:four helix bundle protein [Pirellulales bacterium]